MTIAGDKRSKAARFLDLIGFRNVLLANEEDVGAEKEEDIQKILDGAITAICESWGEEKLDEITVVLSDPLMGNAMKVAVMSIVKGLIEQTQAPAEKKT